MSMLEGISQCGPLSAQCHVWWDAWAVGVAAIAVFATVFLGVATLRLGRQANRLGQTSVKLGEDANRVANLAVEIASEEARSRAEESQTQKLLVLLQIRAEVALAHSFFSEAVSAMSTREAQTQFLTDAGFRTRMRKALFWQRFETAKSLSSRMHYVGHPVAGHLAIVIGLVDHWATFFTNSTTLAVLLTSNDFAETKNVAELLIAHLSPVNAACHAAAAEAGVEST